MPGSNPPSQLSTGSTQCLWPLLCDLQEDEKKKQKYPLQKCIQIPRYPNMATNCNLKKKYITHSLKYTQMNMHHIHTTSLAKIQNNHLEGRRHDEQSSLSLVICLFLCILSYYVMLQAFICYCSYVKCLWCVCVGGGGGGGSGGFICTIQCN